MRPLLKCITAVVFTVCSTFVAISNANGQQLQWVHSSQQNARPTAVAPAKQTQTKKAEVRQPVVKQPTFRQPQQFKQPTAAKPVPKAASAPAPVIENPAPPRLTASVESVRQAARPAESPTMRTVRRRNQPNQVHRQRHGAPRPSGLQSLIDEIVPAQWEEIPPGEYIEGEYPAEEYVGPVYEGEVGCGFPEPTCGCGMECMDPGCAVGFDDACCGEIGGCGCGDACCGEMIGEPTCGCGHASCDDCSHWPQSLFGCDERGCVPILWVPPIKEITFFGGVQGFKSPLDGNRDGGNFGFHQGFNIGGKMAWLPWPGLGYQFGYMATQSQLSGDASTGSDDYHSQHFVTTGLFRRKRLGLQYGVVWDMLRDERQGANDFGQVRGEVSFKNVANRDLGFAFAANSNENIIGTTQFQAADQYLLFYRINGPQGGECRAFAGFTGQSDAVIGSDFHTPLTHRWSLEGNWAYLIPDSGTNGSAARDEAWNLSMQLVWHYGNRAKSWHNRPYRPMFNVADNGSLIVVD